MERSPDAIILAGGKGTRLASVIPDTQKVVAAVGGQPFLLNIFKKLEAAGIKRVILALGYKADDVLQVIASYQTQKLQFIQSVEPYPLGTGGAVYHALPKITTDNVLILNGDSIFDSPLEQFIEFHHEKKANASILLCRVPDTRRYGVVNLDKKSNVIEFVEKPEIAGVEGLINAGAYLLSKKIIKKIRNTPCSLEQNILPALCGNKFYGMIANGNFIDIGTPQDYVRASDYLKK